MLEQVGEAAPALALVLGADVVPELDVGHGHRAVHVEQDLQPVGELVLPDLELRGRDLERCRAELVARQGRGKRQGERQQRQFP